MSSSAFELRVFRYDLPLNRPFRAAGHTFEARSGLLFRLQDEGYTYLAEAAPLPGFSAESLDDIIQHVKNENRWPAFLLGNFPPFYDDDVPPALQFAYSTLWHERRARLDDISLQKSVYAGAHGRLPVNATLGIDDLSATLAQARKFYEDGFRTFKLKVGEDSGYEAEALRQLRETFPDVRLRIDANGAWQPHQALHALMQFAVSDIEYCEQPLPPEDEEGAAWLLPKTSVRIAADEAVRSLADAQRVLNQRLANMLIIKPMLLGSINSFLDVLSLARNTRVPVVVTTALEAGIGRRTTAKLASLIPYPEHAHGLATGGLLKEDICPDGRLIKGGCYQVDAIQEPPVLDTMAESRLKPILQTVFKA